MQLFLVELQPPHVILVHEMSRSLKAILEECVFILLGASSKNEIEMVDSNLPLLVY